jgi:hypothetical protein
MSAQLVKPEAPCKMPTLKITVLLLVPRVHKGLLQALNYAKTISPDTRAVHVNIDPSTAPAIRMEWEQYGEGIPLVVLETPYRSLLEPILEYVDETLLEHPNHVVTVIVPEYVPRRWWQSILHQNLAFRLKLALASRKNVVVTNVRYFLET